MKISIFEAIFLFLHFERFIINNLSTSCGDIIYSVDMLWNLCLKYEKVASDLIFIDFRGFSDIIKKHSRNFMRSKFRNLFHRKRRCRIYEDDISAQEEISF